ncbi:hypothetical protein OROMI_020104 [Orobanche minor]
MAMFLLRYRLSGHQKPVPYISLGPDDDQLLTCGVEETIRRWDVTAGECLHISKRRSWYHFLCLDSTWEEYVYGSY